jgi:hypothetical protein
VRWIVTAVVFLALTAPGLAGTKQARVAIVKTSPVVVHGTGFVAAERVTVTVYAKTNRTRIVTATSTGTFVVRFAHFAIPRCTAYGVRAKGNHGSLVSWKIAPMCAPAGTNGQTSTEPSLLYPNDPVPKKKP